MVSTAQRLRGLVLSANDLRLLHPEWSGAMIEDYLNITDNLILIADETDTKSNYYVSTKQVSSDYVVEDTDQELFCDTSVSGIVVSLPAGIDGRHLRIHNIGENNNAVTIVPNGTDLLFGENQNEVLFDTEVVIITYNLLNGWD